MSCELIREWATSLWEKSDASRNTKEEAYLSQLQNQKFSPSNKEFNKATEKEPGEVIGE